MKRLSRLIRSWRRRRAPLVDEYCAECLQQLRHGHVWELRRALANEAEMGGQGGTYMACSYCEEHAPPDAVRL